LFCGNSKINPRFNIGDEVYQSIDVDKMESNIDEPIPLHIVQIKAVCANKDYWTYKYHVRRSNSFEVGLLHDNELVSHKEMLLRRKLLPDRQTNWIDTTSDTTSSITSGGRTTIGSGRTTTSDATSKTLDTQILGKLTL
jgi:hypothetical protein